MTSSCTLDDSSWWPNTLVLRVFAVCCCLSLASAGASTSTASLQSNMTHDQLSPPSHIVAKFPSSDAQRQRLIRPAESNVTTKELKFNHLTIDPANGLLYAGAVNRLFQLDLNLHLEQFVLTGKFFFHLLLDENNNKLFLLTNFLLLYEQIQN